MVPSTITEQLRGIVLEMSGRKIPAERDLAERLKVGRKQVRAALSILEAEGLLIRRQGSGTYASECRVDRALTVALLVDAGLRLGDDPFFSFLVESLQRTLQNGGIRCLVERVSADNPVVPGVDGVVTAGLAGASVIEAMGVDDPPVVGLLLPENALRIDRRVSVILADDRAAGVCAATRLIERGCRAIVFAGMNDLPMSRGRMAGAYGAARAAGIPLRGIRSGSNFQAGLLVARSLPGEPEETPVGVIAANDWMAVGIRTGLMSRGVPVGGSYHVVGFDGLEIAADPEMGIDSVMFPHDAMVNDAVSELLRLSGNPSLPGRVIRYAPYWRA